ncbi:MAG: transposase [Pseudomonadota bacterium]
MIEATIGIDVSKDRLDAHRLPDGATRIFANDPGGRRALLAWLAEMPVRRIVFEPTGPYHKALEAALARAGLPIAKVNPRQARRFAEATGKLAKTDRIDAALLARFGALLEPALLTVPGEAVQHLKELTQARRALVRDRTAAKNRAATLAIALLRRQNAQRLRQIERQIAALDEAIRATVEGDAVLARRHAILLSIPGISDITAVVMLVEMPELGALETKQAASLAGLAPVDRQSGAWRRRASIRGGRAALRQALFMPALVAARFNPDLKAVYLRLSAAGKPAKVAITAVMRKLLLLANTLLRQDRLWQSRDA